MIRTRLIAIGFAATFASSAQAMPLALHQPPEDLVINVSGGCGSGFHRVNGVCVHNTTVRQVRRYERQPYYGSTYYGNGYYGYGNGYYNGGINPPSQWY
jgi:hypothetical protein